MSTELHRPFKPIEIAANTLEAFQYDSIADALRKESVYATTGRTALAIARSDALTIVLTVIKKGAHILDHKAPGPATVMVLEGRVSFSTANAKLTLGQHSTSVFAADVVHSVDALEDSTFLLVIGGRAD